MSFDHTWRDGVAETPECPPLELLFSGSRDRLVEAHVAGCPHCRTERALFEQVEQSADRTPVEAISKRLSTVNWAEAGRTGIPAKPESLWQRILKPRFFAPASFAFASLLVLVAVVQVNRPAGTAQLPVLGEDAIASQQLRSQQLRGVAPLGQVASTPGQLKWEKVAGAVTYEVRLMEVDHTSIWESRVPEEHAVLPADTVRKILPGKRLLWEVKALGPSGSQIADSGTLVFTTSLQ